MAGLRQADRVLRTLFHNGYENFRFSEGEKRSSAQMPAVNMQALISLHTPA